MRRPTRKQSGTAAIILAAAFLAIQLVPVNRNNPPVKATVQAPAAVTAILKRSCFDCHSNETTWPWYSRVAPVSFFVAEHVHEGRKDLNFSRWPTYDFDAQDLLLRDIHKVVNEGEMPLRTYLLGHPDARLSPAEKKTLLDWAAQGLPDYSDVSR